MSVYFLDNSIITIMGKEWFKFWMSLLKTQRGVSWLQSSIKLILFKLQLFSIACIQMLFRHDSISTLTIWNERQIISK